MKFASKSLVIALASAAALLSGCAKKPARPDPNATLMGPTGGGSGLNPGGLSTTTPNDLSTSGLSDRNSNLNPNGQDRTSMESVYFAFNSSAIPSSERPKLQAAKDYLAKNPTYKLLIEGHCDWRGTSEYNLALGDRRANESKKYLISLGVSADKIDTVSKGSEEATKNADEETMKKERCDNLVGEAPGGGTVPISGGAPATPAPAAGGM